MSFSRFTTLIFGFAAVIAIQTPGAALALTCREELIEAAKTLSHQELMERVEKMDEPEMACLFAYSVDEPQLHIDYFIPNQDALKIYRFHGKSTETGVGKFERHFFLASLDEKLELMGYDYSVIGKIFKSSGMFKSDTVQVPDQLVLGYSHNFKKLLKGQPLPDGAKIKKYRNNEGSSVFDGLREVVRPINENIVVGVTMKRPTSKSPDSDEKFRGYFVLVREPLPAPAAPKPTPAPSPKPN